jgi:D-glycero-alpha-D-manno-heptose 1-phosphate guanylyltransferase
MKAIVLCGGLGTRLGVLTRNTPKPMLSVAGRPFIAHVLDRLCIPELEGIVLAAGFAWEHLHSFVGECWRTLPVQYSVELQALGTGGAIALAMNQLNLAEAIVINGDTLFDIDLQSFLQQSAQRADAPSTTWLALRAVDDCTRYGRVETDVHGRVQSFGEKGHSGAGWINGGIYRLRRAELDRFGAIPFSLESDYLAVDCSRQLMFGIQSAGYFIDIGLPADLARAEADLSVASTSAI